MTPNPFLKFQYKSHLKSHFESQSGSFILEALVSVLIFAMGLIALIGMSAQAVGQVSQSKYRNDASYLAGELIGEMWITSKNPDEFDTNDGVSATYEPWLDRVKAILPEGNAVVDVNGTEAEIVITWANKEDPLVPHQFRTTTQIANAKND